MKKYRIEKSEVCYVVGGDNDIFTYPFYSTVQMKTWYGGKTIKEFGAGLFENQRAQELLDLLNEEL